MQVGACRLAQEKSMTETEFEAEPLKVKVRRQNTRPGRPSTIKEQKAAIRSRPPAGRGGDSRAASIPGLNGGLRAVGRINLDKGLVPEPPEDIEENKGRGRTTKSISSSRGGAASAEGSPSGAKPLAKQGRVQTSVHSANA